MKLGNPILWAGLCAVIFLVWKREEVLSPVPKAALPSASSVQRAHPPAAAPTSAAADEVRAELVTAIAALPRKRDLARMAPEETHDLRALNNQTGALVGTLAEKAQNSPQRRKATLEFFLQCAEDAEIAQSVRALCWWKLTNKTNEWKVFVPLSEAQVPMDIQALAASLNPAQGE